MWRNVNLGGGIIGYVKMILCSVNFEIRQQNRVDEKMGWKIFGWAGAHPRAVTTF